MNKLPQVRTSLVEPGYEPVTLPAASDFDTMVAGTLQAGYTEVASIVTGAGRVWQGEIEKDGVYYLMTHSEVRK